MTDKDDFKDQKKLRKAKIFTPPNFIKQKIGSGGLDPAIIARAEDVIKNNEIDFRPIAEQLLKDLGKAIEEARSSNLKDEASIEVMIYPVAQFKAQGTMFHFPLVSDISDILINFLETITTPVSEDALEIVTAHKLAISAVISSNMTDQNHPQGAELKHSLTDACGRYYKTRKS